MKKHRIPLAVTILVPVLLGVILVQGAAFGASYYFSREADFNDTVEVDRVRLMNAMWTIPSTTQDAVAEIKSVYDTEAPAAQPATEEEITAYRKKYLAAIASDAYSTFYSNFPGEQLGDYADYITVGFFDIPRGRFVTVLCYASGSTYNVSYPGSFDTLSFEGDATKGLFTGWTWRDEKRNLDYLISGRANRITDPENSYWIIRHTALRTVYSESDEFLSRFVWVGVTSIGAMAVLSFLAIQLLLLNPVRRLSKRSDGYVKAMHEGTLEDKFELDKRYFGNEITTLNDSLFYMQDAMKDYAQQVRLAAAREQKTAADMALAERIQASMVPNAPLLADKLAFYGKMHPAKEVGGDFFSYFKIDENRYGFYVADVSGKGVPAALFMARAATVSRLLIGDLDIEKIGYVLAKDNGEDLFVTGFFGVIDTRTNELHYVNCGHEPVFLRHEGKYVALDEAPNLPLGCLEDFTYTKQKWSLSQGDALFLYTDGLSEAMNSNGDLYGKEAILSLLNRGALLSGQELFALVDEDVEGFVAGAPQSDDMCFLFFEYGRHARMAFKPTLEDLEKVIDFVEATLSPSFGPETIAPLGMVLDEILANIVMYSKATEAAVQISYSDEEIRVTLSDDGIAFDPTKAEVRKAEGEPGGFGIKLVSAFSSDLAYFRASGKNLLSLSMKRK